MLKLDGIALGRMYVVRLDRERNTIACSEVQDNHETPLNMTPRSGTLAETAPFDPDKLPFLISSLRTRGFVITTLTSHGTNPQVFRLHQVSRPPAGMTLDREQDEAVTPKVAPDEYEIPPTADPSRDTTQEYDIPLELIQLSRRQG